MKQKVHVVLDLAPEWTTAVGEACLAVCTTRQRAIDFCLEMANENRDEDQTDGPFTEEDIWEWFCIEEMEVID